MTPEDPNRVRLERMERVKVACWIAAFWIALVAVVALALS